MCGCLGTSKLRFSLFVEMFVIEKLYLTTLKHFQKAYFSIVYKACMILPRSRFRSVIFHFFCFPNNNQYKLPFLMRRSTSFALPKICFSLHGFKKIIMIFHCCCLRYENEDNSVCESFDQTLCLSNACLDRGLGRVVFNWLSIC